MSATSSSAICRSRQALMKTCALSTAEDMRAAIADIRPQPAIIDLRAPEIGMVMLRGRIGGDGAPFNIGEATVSRAAIKLDTGEVGYAYLLGRDLERARLAAIIDALGQRKAERAVLEEKLVSVVSARDEQSKDLDRRRTAATRVNFFTMVRGES